MTTKNETRTPQVERPKFLVSIVERGKGKAIINLYNDLPNKSNRFFSIIAMITV